MTQEFYAQSTTNEWYTPRQYIDAVEKAFNGRIELDPASSEAANQIVKAQRIFTAEMNGYVRKWEAETVFCNPPYGRVGNISNQASWAAKMIHEYKTGSFNKGILLVNACTSEKWFQALWQFPICFTNHRIRFIGQSEKKQPTKGNCFVWFGTYATQFAYHFSKFGHVVVPRD